MDTYLRLCPPLAEAANDLPYLFVSEDDPESTVLLQTPQTHARYRTGLENQAHTFTRVLNDSCSQSRVFIDTVLPRLTSLLQNGQNGLVFAMGVTGSGKSYTMFGRNGQAGLVQMTIWALNMLTNQSEERPPPGAEDLEDLIQSIKGDHDRQHGMLPSRQDISITFAELYNEKFLDLFRPESSPLLLKRSRHDDVESCHVEGLSHHPITSTAEACQAVDQACHSRRSFATEANSTSSRSHAILTFHIGGHALTLVDLAGSERQKQSGTQGQQLSEAGRINLSLLAVGQCLQALRRPSLGKEGRFPARQSRLTQLLFDGRFWSSTTSTVPRVAMLMCLDPRRFFEENVQMLKYAGDGTQIRAGSRLSRPKTASHAISAKQLELVDRLAYVSSDRRSHARGKISFEVRADSEDEAEGETIDYWRSLAKQLLAERDEMDAQIRQELADEAEQAIANMERRHREELNELRQMYERRLDAKVDLLAISTSNLALRSLETNTLKRKSFASNKK